MDDDQQMTGDRYLFRIPGQGFSLSPSFYLYYETTGRFVGRGKAAGCLQNRFRSIPILPTRRPDNLHRPPFRAPPNPPNTA